MVERLADLNKRLTEAEAERISLQGQVQLIRQRAFESLPDVINNKLIQTLKEQLSRLEGDYANLSAEYNLGYPRLAQVKAQLDETRRRLNEEIRSVVGGIESAFLAAGAKEKELRGEIRRAKKHGYATQRRVGGICDPGAGGGYKPSALRQHISTQERDGVAAELRTSNVVYR